MPAPWTEPRTWSFEEVVTAAQLNEQLRDNLKHIGPESGMYNRRQTFDIRTEGATGDGVAGDLAAVKAAAQKATDAGGGVVFFPEPPSGGFWNVEGGFPLANYDCTLLGTGTPNCIIKAASQSGPVIDFTDWAGRPPNNIGKVPFGGFTVKGDGTSNDTKANVGIDFADRGQGLWAHNIAIEDTGGPPVKMGGIWGTIFQGLVMGRPVDANVNDVPYLHITNWVNGCTFLACGFRSITTDLDGSAVVLIEWSSDRSHDTLWSGTWTEFLHVPEGGAIFDVDANSFIFDGLQMFDTVQQDGATESYVYRLRAGNGNEVRGVIPGRGTATTSIRYGVGIDSSRHRVVGTRGFRDNNVWLKSGVQYNHIELGGQRSGTTNPDAVIDDSGNSDNTWFDHTVPIMFWRGVTLQTDKGRFVVGDDDTGQLQFGTAADKLRLFRSGSELFYEANRHQFRDLAATQVARLFEDSSLSDGETALELRVNIGGTTADRLVAVGTADSGDTGYRVLQVVN